MKDILIQGAASYGLTLPDTAADEFRAYYEFLVDKNSIMNLTAISGEREVTQLHFLDSLALLTLDDCKGKSVIDIGSGAGFPGIPLKIAEPSVNLTLLDAQQKKVAFLEELCKAIGRTDVVCLHARAEEAALTAMRDCFDVAVSRAVARLNTLSELCLPFVKPGGLFIAMKGTASDDEIKEAEHAITVLGAKLDCITDYTIPGTDVSHRAVIIRKMSPTPAGYPRRFAKIQKSPL